MMAEASRRTALAVALIGAIAFLALVWWQVPWDPVPGGGLDPVSARSVFTHEEIKRAEDYSQWARVWSWSSLVVSLLVACWFGFTRRGRAVFDRVRGPWWLQVLQIVAVLAVVGRLLTLPFAVAHRALQRDYDLSNQAWSAYAVDVVKGELVTIVVTSLALVVVMACARRWQRAWPAVAGALLVALVVAGSFVYPVVVEPVFNDFTKLTAEPLRSEIFALADEEGVPIDDVLVADASRRTTTLNAYVSGFGGTRRVVVYDTLVESLPEDQALSVVAHELAHARHDDVATGTALGAAGVLVGVGLLALLLGRLRRRGWPAMDDARVVPTVLATVALASLVTAPVQNGISRQIETRADVDALTTTGDSEAFVAMQRRLALRSLADPTPMAWSQWWFGSHPTVLKRIALAVRMTEE
jgi:STE24 endopeptidase